MNPRIKEVKPQDDYVIALTFDNGKSSGEIGVCHGWH